MSGGGSSQTTESNPWSGAVPYLEGILSDAQSLYENSPGYSGLSEEQFGALTGLQNLYQSGFNGTTDQARNTWTNLMRSPEEVATSQAVQDMIATNTGNVTQQLAENVLPQIRAGSATAGQYGSTRQGIAEGLATERAANAAQDYATNLTGNIYQQQLNNQLNALGYTGAMQGSLANANQGLFDIASIIQQDKDSAQDYDWGQLQKLFGFVQPSSGLGGTTVSTSSGGGTSRLQGAAGGAAAGTAIMPGWGTAIGAGLGALMG